MYSACGSYKNLDTHTHLLTIFWGDERELTAERHPGTSHYRKQIAAQKKGLLIFEGFEGELRFFVEKGNCVLRRKSVILLEK